MVVSGGPRWPEPHLRRWMLFVDGENLAIRGRTYAEHHRIDLDNQGGTLPHERDVYLWCPKWAARRQFLTAVQSNDNVVGVQDSAVRAYYYASVAGDDDRIRTVRDALWELGFTAKVFKKAKPAYKAKGVDIAITTDMLSNAFLNNYDVAVLVAGDGDYVPLVEEVKRLGKVVVIASFCGKEHGFSDDLRLSADAFFDMGVFLATTWPPLPSEMT